jgi:hypothetical protein
MFDGTATSTQYGMIYNVSSNNIIYQGTYRHYTLNHILPMYKFQYTKKCPKCENNNMAEILNLYLSYIELGDTGGTATHSCGCGYSRSFTFAC